MLVRTNDGAIHVVDAPVDPASSIGLGVHLRKDAVPEARLLPSVEAPGHCGPAPVAFGQVPPRRTRAQDPQDAVNDLPVIDRRSASMGFLRWQQRLQPLPLLVGQFEALYHTDQFNPVSQVLKHSLVRHRPALLLSFSAFAFEFARRALRQAPAQPFDHWGARNLGDEFRQRVAHFDPEGVNLLPLLHATIARGKWRQSHDYFCGYPGGNYFTFTGNAIAGKLIEYRDVLPVWVDPPRNGAN